jgi:Pvc16 N-terminal domain
MLHELDTALRRLVERELGETTDVEIDFDAPTKDWASHRNGPTIDIYLYDIRQDVTRSQFGQLQERDGDGIVTRRRPQPKYFRLAYLVTAWTQRAEDEHRLLSALLVAFLKHEIVPPDLLGGSVAELGLAVPLALALPPPQDRSLSDVWSALGGELKPSLDLILIAPLVPDRVVDAGPPVTKEPLLTLVDRRNDTAETHGGRTPVPADTADAGAGGAGATGAGGSAAAAAAGSPAKPRRPPPGPDEDRTRSRIRIRSRP